MTARCSLFDFHSIGRVSGETGLRLRIPSSPDPVAVLLKGWRLWSPSQAFEIGVFAIRGEAAVRLVRFTLGAAFVLFPLLHLFGFLAITLGDCCFSWSSDGNLLVPD